MIPPDNPTWVVYSQQRQDRFPKLQRVEGANHHDNGILHYEITIPESALPGDYRIALSSDQGYRDDLIVYLRVLRSRVADERARRLASGSPREMLQAAEYRSHHAVQPIADLLANNNGPRLPTGLVRRQFWEALAMVGNSQAAEVLIQEPSYQDYDMELHPRRYLEAIHFQATDVCLGELQRWEQNLRADDSHRLRLLTALTVLGDNQLLQERATLQRMAKELISTHAKLVPSGNAEARNVLRQFLACVLGKFSKHERQFVLQMLLEYHQSSDLLDLAAVLPEILAIDPEWMVDELWKAAVRDNDAELTRALAIGFAARGIFAERWIRSIRFEPTTDYERFLLREIQKRRPDLAKQ